jgi:lipid-binding SYLF domain-containing protein
VARRSIAWVYEQIEAMLCLKTPENAMHRLHPRPSIASCLLAVLALHAFTPASFADEAQEAQKLVEEARVTFENFVADPDMEWFREHVRYAKAVLIVPQLVKGGLIFGGSGGNGVLLGRDEHTGQWSYPAFYTMGSISWGLQLGAEVAEVVLLAMTYKGLESFLQARFQLGADASIAAGPVGVGAQAATVDIIQFSRTKGIFGGLTVEGAIIGVRHPWNHAYYGTPVSPLDILVRHIVSNLQARPLLTAVKKAADPSRQEQK